MPPFDIAMRYGKPFPIFFQFALRLPKYIFTVAHIAAQQNIHFIHLVKAFYQTETVLSI